jgi:hypothetical protein
VKPLKFPTIVAGVTAFTAQILAVSMLPSFVQWVRYQPASPETFDLPFPEQTLQSVVVQGCPQEMADYVQACTIVSNSLGKSASLYQHELIQTKATLFALAQGVATVCGWLTFIMWRSHQNGRAL